MNQDVLFIDDEQVRELLSQQDVLEAVESTFRALGNGQIRHPRKDPLWLDDYFDNLLLAMPAFLMNEGVAGMKWVSMFMRQKAGYPSSFGNLIILNRADTGAPFALVEATSITQMRTGGGHAVIAAKHLSKKNSERLTIIGCGDQGINAIRGFMLAFNLREIRLCDLSEAAMDRCIAEFSDTGVVFRKFTSAREAVKGSDIVLVVTTSKKALMTADMAEPGMTILGLNAFYDLSPDFAGGNFRWILGYCESDDSQIIQDPELAQFHLSMDNVAGDLGQVVTGKVPGRTSEDEIVVYTHMGIGSLDLACALITYRRAMEKNIGQVLKFKG